MGLIQAILTATSLCADCFAVALCSSVSSSSISKRDVLKIALIFAVIHTSLLLAGWLFGTAIVNLVAKAAHLIGFLLLLYVGGNMLIEGIRGKENSISIGNIKNIVLGSLATSIDALAVGAAQSLEGAAWANFIPLMIFLFVITIITVSAGIMGGNRIGRKFGRVAEIVGGIVLITIGITILV